MKRKPIVISVLMVGLLLLGLSIGSLASDQTDIDFAFVEDSGDYIRTGSLLPEDAEDAAYDCDLYLRYGWLAVEEDGDFRYELDTDNGDAAVARKSRQTLTEYVTLRYRDEEDTPRLLTVRFVIRPREEESPDGSYALVNDGTAAVAEGNFFRRDETEPDKKAPALLGVFFAGGEYMLHEDLMLTYSLSNWNWDVQQLSQGEQCVQRMKFRLQADDGSTITRVVGITVSGTDDVPTVQNATRVLTLSEESGVSGSALEGSTLGDGAAAQHRFTWTTAASAARYGTVVLNEDGSYSYKLNLSCAEVGGLTDGAEPLREAFAYTYADKDGSLAEGSVIFAVAYGDISPVVADQTATLTEDAGQDNDDPCYTFAGSALTGSVPGNGTTAQHAFVWTSSAASDYGTVELNADGTFSFRMDNASDAVQNLYPGSDVRQTYGYTYTDAEGDQATGAVTITLQGANDLPRLQSFTHTFTEDTGVSADEPTYACRGNALTGVIPGDGAVNVSRFAWSADNAARYGVMTADADGGYTYMLSNDSRAVQALTKGEAVEDVFAYTYTDDNGDAVSGAVTVTVIGAKDAPTLENKSATLSLGGPVRAAGNALTNSALGDGSREEHRFAWTTATTAAQYGTMTLEDDGGYTYELDRYNETVCNRAKDDAPLTEVFSFTYSNGQDTATASVTITIRYQDIHPIAANVVREVSEDGTDENNASCLPLTGNVLSDCALGNGLFAAHSFTWTSSASEAQYGTVTLNPDGTYRYTMDADDIEACQSMKAGEIKTEVFRFNYRDADDDTDESGSLTIRIMGVNDAPVWNGVGFDGLTEDAVIYTNASGPGFQAQLPTLSVNASDVESDVISFVCQQQGPDTYGETSISDGLLTITLNKDNAAFQALTGTATLKVTYDIYISDGTASVLVGRVNITIRTPN